MFWVLALTVFLFATPCRAQVSPSYPSNEREMFHLGGTGVDGDFTYNGECSGACTGAVCAGGTCSGSAPCTCTLTGNSYLLHTPGDNSTVPTSVVRNYSTFLLSDGTLTVDSLGAHGTALVIRVNADIEITGGTIDLKGKGGVGATGGACLSSAPGIAGAANTMNAGGVAGASGVNNGSNGVQTGWAGSHSTLAPFFLFPVLIGSGGGTAPVSGQTPPFPVTTWAPSVAGTGGGGGGCGASCSGTVSDGGRGGGMLRFEAAGTYTCTGATLDVRGNAGAVGGGGGGGGGGIHVLAWNIGTETCANFTGGGTGDATPPTNCGTGGNGGAGSAIIEAVPR